MRVVKPINFNALAFERESEATYYDENGILVTAANDVLRFGYNPATLESIGPIFESEQTNYATYSNNFINAAWFKSSSPTLTPSAGTSPDGNFEATLYLNDGFISKVLPAPMTNMAFSLYIKAQSPAASPTGSTLNLQVDAGSTVVGFKVYSDAEPTYVVVGSLAQVSIQKLPGGWYRVALFRAAATQTFTISQSSSLDPFFIFGAQVEQISGSFFGPSSYISAPSSTPEVRAADVQNDPPSLSSSNIHEPDYPEWTAGLAYLEGYEVTVLGNYNRNYRALADVAADVFPPDNPDKWLDLGSTNRWRMFNNMVGADLQSSNAGSVDVTLSLAGRINTVALFNVSGVSATVRMFYDGEVIYEKTVSLTAPASMTGWWAFWFEERRKIKVLAFTDLPPATNSSVQIIIDGGDGTAAIGKAILGYGRDLGFAEYGTTSAGIIDYSTKEVDAFGNYFFLERRFVDTMDLRVVVDPGRESMVKDTLAEGRAKPYVYIGEDGYESLIILGRYMDFSILFSTPAASYCSMRIEGI